MANNIINSSIDPGIATVKPVASGPIASSTTVNTTVDSQIPRNRTIGSSNVATPPANTQTVMIPPASVVEPLTINSIIESVVKNYVDSASGSVSSAARAAVADVANSVAYGNITNAPSFAAVAFSGDYSSLVNLPSLSGYATTSYVSSAISNLINSSPAALNTLNELANAIANDSGFSTTVSTALGNRLRIDTSTQNLSNTEKANAKTNLGLANVAVSGSYSDLSDKPSIPAAQIQSDWNITDNTLKSYIANKPALFSGSYADLSSKPTIPDAQIQSDWTQSDNALKDFIKNKPTIPAAQIQSDWTQATNTALDFIKNKPTLVTNLDSLSDVTITSASSGQVLKFNGTAWINDAGGGASTGNITFSDTTMSSTNGNVKISFSPTASPAVEFTFANNGSFITNTVRGTSKATSLLNTDGVGIRIDSLNEPTSIDIGDITGWDYVRLQYGEGSVTGNEGDVEIRSTPMGSPAEPSSISISPQGGVNGSFTFAGDGKLVLPAGSTIHEESSPTGVGSSLTLTPADGSDDNQKLMVYPTQVEGEGNHLHLTSGNLEVTSLFLGNDSQYVRTTADGGITIGTNDTIPDDIPGTGNRWKFGTDGDLVLPAGGDIKDSTGTSVLGGSSSGTGDFTFSGNIMSVTPDNDMVISVIDENEDGLAVKQSVTDGNTELALTSLEIGQFSIYPNGSAGEEWRFDGDTLQVTNDSFIRGFASNVVLQSMVSGSGGIASLQSVSNQNDPNIFTTIDATTSGANIKVYNGGSSGGTEFAWRFDNTGSLTVPGHILPSANVLHDLGSETNRFRDLYLSGSTIDLGGTLIQAQSNGQVSIGNATFSSSGTISAADVVMGIINLNSNTTASTSHVGTMVVYSPVSPYGITYDIPNVATAGFTIGSRIELFVDSQSTILVGPVAGSGVSIQASKGLDASTSGANTWNISNTQIAKLTMFASDKWLLSA
jgi:hypothetical protein